MKKFLLCFTLSFLPFLGIGQILEEGFDDITTLGASGWVQTNNSSPLGTTDWFQGSTPFTGQAGGPTSYIAANYNNTAGGTGTISNWLITPVLTLTDGDVLKFWTRIPAGSIWDDRLEVRLSTGTGSDVGTTATSVGTFTTTLLTINDDYTLSYPEEWTEYTINIAGLSGTTQGRIAFRYNVILAGPTGTYSNYIGIDTVSVHSSLGIGEVEASGLSYYPNPVKDYLTIDSQKTVESISAFNLAGQKVLDNANLTAGRLDMSHLSAGVYVFKVAFQGGAVETLKIVKE